VSACVGVRVSVAKDMDTYRILVIKVACELRRNDLVAM